MLKILIVSIITFAFGRAYAEEACPAPTQQIATDVKGKIDGDLSTLFRFGKIKVSGDVETVTREFFKQYPNADRVAITQNVLSIVCQKVLSSQEYSEEFRKHVIDTLLCSMSGISCKECRLVAHGIEREAVSLIVDKASGWVGGGSGIDYVSLIENSILGEHPGYHIDKIEHNEDSRKDWAGHAEYQFHVKAYISSPVLYIMKADAECP